VYLSGTVRAVVPPSSRSLVARHPSVEPELDRAPAADGQRARLLEAMTQVVATKGYAATTVADVVRAARVSRSTFYELFESKEQCFAEGYRHGVEVMFDGVRAAGRAARTEPWPSELRASNLAYLTALRDEPLFARTYLLEIHRAGELALDARGDALARFAAGFRHLERRVFPDRAPQPREAYLVLAAGLDQVSARWLRAGRVQKLPALEPTFTHCALAILGDPASE
jgi:AcrR family transcriptional regulator